MIISRQQVIYCVSILYLYQPFENKFVKLIRHKNAIKHFRADIIFTFNK